MKTKAVRAAQAAQRNGRVITARSDATTRAYLGKKLKQLRRDDPDALSALMVLISRMVDK
jgi:hypothetical protein